MNNTETAACVQQTEATLLAYCRRQGLLQSGNRVIAACSGGADSMALLLFLLRCRKLLGIDVLAAHVDHGIRGAASRADADFVADFCRKNGVELLLYDALREGVNVPPRPSEEWARGLRYAFFDRIAAQRQALVATAHTCSDQAETVLFRMARGTGLHGMGGISPRRGCYRRPLLCLTRSETEAYCAALGQSYVQDETNRDPIYARNRIRQDAVPALCYANPAAERNVVRLCEQLRALDDWLNQKAAALLQQAAAGSGYRLQTLQTADEPVLSTAMHRLVGAERDPEEKLVSLLCAVVLRGEGAVQLTTESRYVVHGDVLVREECCCKMPPPAPPQPLAEGHFSLPDGYIMEIQRLKYEKFLKNQAIFKNVLNYAADCAKIQGNIQLRTRDAGDTFRPAGRHVRKTLKKFYNEQGYTARERRFLPLLARGSEVLWLWGCGFAEGTAPNDGTDEVLHIQIKKTGEE